MEIRTSALLAGAGILVICFVAGYGEVSRQQILRDLGMDLYGAAVTEDLGSANVAGALLTVCYCFLVVGVVDIGVAFSLYSWLDVSSHHLALFVAWLRVAYTILELSATSGLIVALACWHRDDAAGMHGAMWQFEIGWNGVALAVFGLHLIFLGLGVATIPHSSAATRMLYGVGDVGENARGCSGLLTFYFLALLLVVAGVGYVGDSLGLVYSLPHRPP